MKIRNSAAMGVAVTLLVGPATTSADVVLDWNTILVSTLAGQNPLAEIRYAAMTQLAVFEAVNAVTHRYRPYLGTITAPPGASAEAAAIAAAHGVLVQAVPGAVSTLDAQRAASLVAIPDGQPKQDGIAVGEAAAAAIIAERANDGWTPPEFYLPASPAPGVWQLTPVCSSQGGVFRHAPNIRPFAIRSADQFRSPRPPSLKSPRYTQDYLEVKKVGASDSAHRPPDRADVARFYAAVLNVPTWNPAVRQVAAQQGRPLTENARALALLNMALMDGLIAVMDTKYHHTFWRPETAIRAGHTDGNPATPSDPDFKPFVTTPCHPSYPSAHASLGGGARRVAERIFGAGGHSITMSNPAVPGVVLHYAKFRDISRDIDDARIYGGIHFRFDQVAGNRQGREVGSYVYRTQLRPLQGHPPDEEDEEEAADDDGQRSR